MPDILLVIIIVAILVWMFRTPTRPNRRGFTLIELIVVIAIIGIISSVLLASVSNAKKHEVEKTPQNKSIRN